VNDVIIQSPFLRTSRSFPADVNILASEVNRSYVDIARNVNRRTIGLFPTTRSIVNGELWYITLNQQQQALRQVYQWDDSNLTIAHGIDFLSLSC
jgi:hypothetical protein